MSRRIYRPASLPCTIVAVLAIMLLTYPGGILAAYRDFRDMSTYQQRLELDTQERQRLDCQAIAINNRIMIKDALIDELIAGEISLLEVAEKFCSLNEGIESNVYVLENRYPGVHHLERSALNVIDFVNLRELPQGQHRRILARLRAEYEQAFGHRYSDVH